MIGVLVGWGVGGMWVVRVLVGMWMLRVWMRCELWSVGGVWVVGVLVGCGW